MQGLEALESVIDSSALGEFAANRSRVTAGGLGGLVRHPKRLRDMKGRLQIGRDVPARLAVILSRSNRVLTLQRIVHAQPQIPAALRTDPSKWRVSCIPFWSPHLPRTGVGVVPVVR
jgi:hypothetical protein